MTYANYKEAIRQSQYLEEKLLAELRKIKEKDARIQFLERELEATGHHMFILTQENEALTAARMPPADTITPEQQAAMITIDHTNVFSKLRLSSPNNDSQHVNQFLKREDDHDEMDTLQRDGPLPRLVTKLAPGIRNSGFCIDAKFHAMGVVYTGAIVGTKQLRAISAIEQAFGVEKGNLNFLVVILSKTNGRRIESMANIIQQLIPATPMFINDSHHISVYIPHESTDDPVLTMLKKPNPNKWQWTR